MILVVNLGPCSNAQWRIFWSPDIPNKLSEFPWFSNISSILYCLRTSKGLSLGELITSYFHPFLLLYSILFEERFGMISKLNRLLSSTISVKEVLQGLWEYGSKRSKYPFWGSFRASEIWQHLETFMWTKIEVLYIIGKLEESRFVWDKNQSNPFSRSEDAFQKMKLCQTSAKAPNLGH